MEYALRNMNCPLGIATYTVTPQLANFAGDLPSPEGNRRPFAGLGRLSADEGELRHQDGAAGWVLLYAALASGSA